MVLLNIGVDCNAVTLSGFTPLYLSVATGSMQAQVLLREQGALLRVDQALRVPGATVLDIHLGRKRRAGGVEEEAAIVRQDKQLGLPSRHTMF